MPDKEQNYSPPSTAVAISFRKLCPGTQDEKSSKCLPSLFFFFFFLIEVHNFQNLITAFAFIAFLLFEEKMFAKSEILSLIYFTKA